MQQAHRGPNIVALVYDEDRGFSSLLSAGKRLDLCWLVRLAIGVALGSPAIACVRPPLPGSCPKLDAGALVVSELRGAQSGSYRQWIELYNASDAKIAVGGLRLEFTRPDGSGAVAFIVRDEGLEVEPGAYVVLGGGDPETEDYIDYDYTPDYHSADNPDQPRSLYGAATLTLYGCDVAVDRVVYASLPNPGTLALDGAAPPDAARNDKSSEGWCVDERVSEGPQTEIGLRGSPGEPNPPCP